MGISIQKPPDKANTVVALLGRFDLGNYAFRTRTAVVFPCNPCAK